MYITKSESKYTKTITIACPIRDRSWILNDYLNHIYNLDYPKHLINILWIINQSSDNSEKILRRFQSEHYKEYNNIKITNYFGVKKVPKDDRYAHIRNQFTYSHLSEIRNYILKNSTETDYLLSVDSDILIPPDTLTKLLFHNKDICAGIIWNGYLVNAEKPWLHPNILRKIDDSKYEHISNSYVKKSPQLNDSKLVRVDATGAFVLMANKVVKNTSYGWHGQGEDLFWSLECEKKGFEMYADYAVFGRHIMSKELL